MADCRVHRSDAGEDLETLALATYDRLAWLKPDYGVADIRDLGEGPWALLVLDTLDGQVANGGFSQLFYNQGDLAMDAPTAAERVGASGYAQLARAALSLVPGGELPADEETRIDTVDALLEDEASAAKLSELDDAFYDLGTGHEGLWRWVREYVERNPERFFLSDDEARRDVDELLRRLHDRVGPMSLATADDLDEAATRLGQPLPDLLMRLYGEVGDGGWGPDMGLLPLLGAERASVVGWWEWARRELRGPHPWSVWQPDTFPIARADEGVVCADFAEPLVEVSLFEPDEEPYWSSFEFEPGPVLSYHATSLRGWLEEWLRAGG